MDKEKTYKYKKGVSEDHLKYLEGIYLYHKDRNGTIENKLSQISNQSGLILTLISLYIPIFYNKLLSFNPIFKLFVLIVFLLGFTLLMISIVKSRNFLNISKYKYVVNDSLTVFKDHTTKAAFVKEQIEDYLFAIKENSKITNEKGSILIVANKFFTGGLITIAVLSLSLIINSLFVRLPEKETEVVIKNQLNLENVIEKLDDISTRLDSLKYQNSGSKITNQ